MLEGRHTNTTTKPESPTVLHAWHASNLYMAAYVKSTRGASSNGLNWIMYCLTHFKKALTSVESNAPRYRSQWSKPTNTPDTL